MTVSPEIHVDVSIGETFDPDDEDVPETAQLVNWVRQAITGVLTESSSTNKTDKPVPLSVSLRIADADEIQQLNTRFRNKNRPTNVLSFPMPELEGSLGDSLDLCLLGDIALCAPVIREEAKQQGKQTEAHWAHMVIHGMLHLQGYDHIEPDQAEVMEQLEVSLLNRLGFRNPYQ